MRSRTIASRQTEYRAAAGSSSLAQAKFHQSDHTAQLKTAIKHFTGTLDVLDEKRTVGKEVQASLDPKDPVVGSATGVNTDWMKS